MHLYRRFCGQRRWDDDHHHLQRAADRNANRHGDTDRYPHTDQYGDTDYNPNSDTY